jgi:hypothetical protein
MKPRRVTGETGVETEVTIISILAEIGNRKMSGV